MISFAKNSSKSVVHTYKQNSNKQPRKNHGCTFIGCNMVFSRPYRLQAHLRVHTGEKPFSCPVSDCGKSYTNKSHLSRHKKSVHQSPEDSKNIDYSCSICENEFSNRQNLKKHIARKHNKDFPYFCEICQTGYKKKTILAQHMFFHTGVHPFQCSLCPKTFATIIEFHKHKRNHKTYMCFCKQEFTRWSDVLKHRKIEHTFTEFICDFCKKVFKSKYHIQRHMKMHSISFQEDVFPCPYQCPKFYSTKNNLMHHINSVHEGSTYDCTFDGCNAKLSTKKKLELHAIKHTNPLPPKKRNPRIRKKRKDFGEKKRSMAVKLSGITLPIASEKNIINKDIFDVSSFSPEISIN